GELEPFVLVVEGSIPNEAIKSEGYWCGFGNNPETDQPMTTSEWLDRFAPKGLAVLAVGTCAPYGGIPALAGTPTAAARDPAPHDGRPRLPRVGLEVEGGPAHRVRPRVPRAPGQPLRDHPLPAVPGDRPGADDPARRCAATAVVVRRHRPRGL